MKRHVLLLVSLFYACISAGQTDKDYNGALTRLVIKASFVDIALQDLNSALHQGGYETFDNISNFEYSLVTQPDHKRWGSTLSFMQINADKNDQYTIDPDTFLLQNRTLKGWGLKCSYDYYVWQRRLWKLYVPINLQWMKYKLTTFENIPTNFHLGNSSGIMQNQYTSWRPSIESGLNLETGFRAGDAIFIFGINAGYRFDYGEQDWKYSDEISVGFPTLKNQGFVLGISFGISAARRLLKPKQM